jgi:hypothetical protein
MKLFHGARLVHRSSIYDINDKGIGSSAEAHKIDIDATSKVH